MAKNHSIISPEQIQLKATRLYPRFVGDWLTGTDPFPLVVRASLPIKGNDYAGMIAAVERLRNESKEKRGFGYHVHWRTFRSRSLGENAFPDRIEIETEDDLLRLIDKGQAFARLRQAVDDIRSTLLDSHVLEPWLAIKSNWEKLEDEHLDVCSILAVAGYFLEHPRPDCFARELPISVDTKFIERNAKILREWLDCLLPPSAIDVNESKFARRFGLRDGEQQYLVRVLDPNLRGELALPFDEFSAPLRSLNALPVSQTTVIIVENKVNLLTLPPRPRTLGMGGVGNGVNQVARLPWLADARILYWGDIDVDGFRILSSLRKWLPQTESFLMSEDVLDRFERFIVPNSPTSSNAPPHLTPTEMRTFDRCRQTHVRLEQEHLPSEFVNAAIPP